MVELPEGCLRDSLGKALSSIVDDGLVIRRAPSIPFYFPLFSSGLAIPKCCDYEVWEELARQTLVSASFLIVGTSCCLHAALLDVRVFA